MNVRSLAGFVLFAGLVAACGGGGNPGSSAATDAFSRALQAQTANKFDDAVAAYYEVLSKEPKNTGALFNLGLIAHIQKRLVAAEAYYRLALEIDAKHEKSLFNLAIVRKDLGAPQEAIALYRQVIVIDPTYADAHFNLGLALRETGQNAEGQQELAKAQQLDPKLVAPGPPATPARQPSPTPTR